MLLAPLVLLVLQEHVDGGEAVAGAPTVGKADLLSKATRLQLLLYAAALILVLFCQGQPLLDFLDLLLHEPLIGFLYTAIHNFVVAHF